MGSKSGRADTQSRSCNLPRSENIMEYSTGYNLFATIQTVFFILGTLCKSLCFMSGRLVQLLKSSIQEKISVQSLRSSIQSVIKIVYPSNHLHKQSLQPSIQAILTTIYPSNPCNHLSKQSLQPSIKAIPATKYPSNSCNHLPKQSLQQSSQAILDTVYSLFHLYMLQLDCVSIYS